MEQGARVSRRGALRTGAGALIAGAGAALAGCVRTGMPRVAASARPQPTNTPITLHLQPLIEGGLAPMRSAQEAVMAGFERSHPGVRVVMSDPAGTTTNIAAILAGHGPDVFWDFHYAPYLAKSALLRLDEFLSQDNVDPDIWSAAQMSTLRTSTPAFSGTFALPCFFGTMVYVVNLQDLGNKGIEPPGAGWTMDDFVTIAQRLSGTGSSGARHYGASMEWYADQTNDGEVHWLFSAFGGTYIDGAGTAVQLTQPGSVAAGQWIYGELLWPEYAIERDDGDATPSRFTGGMMSMAALGNWDLKTLVSIMPHALDFDFFPFPVFPTGRTSFGTDDFYAIGRTTKYPEQAWALLKWLSADTVWQQAQIRLQLLSPALNALWPQWVETVQQASPVLKGKAVHWFADAATGAYALPPQYFVAADAQAQGLMGNFVSQLHNRRLTVDVAFQQAQNAINPLVAQAVAQAQQQAASSTATAGNAAFAPPPQTGLGQPPQPATGLVQVGGGGYTLSGVGSGVLGATDGCVFTCLPLQQGGGQFICRLTALSAAGGATADPLASAGLMARGDLSDNAPALALEVTAGRGVLAQLRQQARGGLTTAGPATPATAAGLIGARALALPLWLQLQRQGLNWALLTSTDGSRWTPAGPAQPLPVAGCWIGLYATAHGGAPLRATFDHVNFTAQGAYLIG